MSNVYLMLLATTIIGGLGWLIQQKDSSRQADIQLLFKKHEDYAAKLEALQLELAHMYYAKPEIDARIDRITVGIDRLSAEMKNLTEAVLRGCVK